MADKEENTTRYNPSFGQALVAGGIAGTAVDTALFPLDTIKTRLQSKSGFHASGGFHRIYSGLSSAIIGSAPGASAFFVTYEYFKGTLELKFPEPKYFILIHSAAGSAGEVAACVVRVPTEVIKQRMQTKQYHSTPSAIRAILTHEGVLGLYRGYLSTVSREIPFTCLQFPLYEYLKRLIAHKTNRPRVEPWEASICGSIAGGTAAALTTPLDVIKTRIMLSSKHQNIHKYSGVVNTFQRIISEEGARALISGIGPRVIWISIGGSIFLGVYEKFDKQFHPVHLPSFFAKFISNLSAGIKQLFLVTQTRKFLEGETITSCGTQRAAVADFFMMSKHIVRLCRHIILDDFGEYVDRVAKVLLEKGRVSFYTIRRLSQLDVRKIKESLLILIQHNLAYWAEIPENNRSVVYYHIEIKEVLARDRFGIYLRHCDELTGHAYQILLFLLLNGKVTLKSLIEELEGIGKSDIIPDIKLCFTSLVDHSYLIPVQISDTQSALDKRNVAEAIKLREQAIVLPTKKELAEIRARIDQDKRASDEAVTQSLKRKADDPGPLDPNKAQKTQEILDEDIYFRVNYERFNILERNAQIVSFAEERFNKSAAHVMRMILQNANEWKSNYGKPESVPLSFTTIVKMISPSSGIANEIVIKKEREDPTHYQVLKHYLDILAENDAKFLRKKDDQMGGIYLVLYQDICDKMKQTKVESILQEKYGRHSVRIFRILLTKGKLDEHNIARFALLSYLETRKLLNDLFLADYIQLQEIPKGTERTPSRTIFLWYVDLDNTYKKVLADLYRSLANLYDRRLYECGKRQKLIEKRDRASIIGNEALLSEQEKQAAAVFEKVLERIERAEVRLVELIMLMSDFK